jgi:ATP-dependent DNA ligase
MPVRTLTRLFAIEPIVPTARPLPFNDPAWLFEPKHDGFRGMLYLAHQACTLYSKLCEEIGPLGAMRPATPIAPPFAL